MSRVLSCLSLFLVAATASAALPYASRTSAYSGFGTTVLGDIRTVGMAGATVGLADTFIAAADNPAGLAMSLNNADANIARSRAHDAFLQDYAARLETSNLGACVNLHPWGLSLGYFSPYRESQTYTLQTYPNDPALLEVRVSKFTLSVARAFLNNRLSLGASFVLTSAETKMEFQNLGYLNSSISNTTSSGVFGASFQMPRRFLLGAGIALPVRLEAEDTQLTTPPLPGAIRDVYIPARFSLGLGWVPNRFFRADFTTHLIGPTHGTALIRDERARVGEKTTLQPRIGIAYNFLDYKALRATVFLGTYREVSRISGVFDRTHFTWGVETKPWIFTLGWGMDAAEGYNNYLASVGVDLVRVLEKLYLIPSGWRPASAGFFPNPFQYSDEGLARALQKDWKPVGPDMNPFKVSADIPAKLRLLPEKLPNAFIDSSSEIQQLGEDMLDAIGTLPRKLNELNEMNKRKP